MSAERSFESYSEAPDIAPEIHIQAWVNFYAEIRGGLADPADAEQIASLVEAVSASTGLEATSRQVRFGLMNHRIWQLAQQESATPPLDNKGDS